MATTYKFSISSESPKNQYITLEISKNLVKHPVFGKFNFTRCSFNIIKNKINNVAIEITPNLRRPEEAWILDIEQNKNELIKLINLFVAKYIKNSKLLYAIQFDTSILAISDSMTPKQLQKVSTQAEKKSADSIWINLTLKSKTKLTK
jgi:hypothetical protein